MIRWWSEHVFAVYVPDGLFGRRVALVDVREDLKTVAAQATRGDQLAGSNKRRISAPGGSALTLRPPDDLNPILLFSPGSEAPA